MSALQSSFLMANVFKMFIMINSILTFYKFSVNIIECNFAEGVVKKLKMTMHTCYKMQSKRSNRLNVTTYLLMLTAATILTELYETSLHLLQTVRSNAKQSYVYYSRAEITDTEISKRYKKDQHRKNNEKCKSRLLNQTPTSELRCITFKQLKQSFISKHRCKFNISLRALIKTHRCLVSFLTGKKCS